MLHPVIWRLIFAAALLGLWPTQSHSRQKLEVRDAIETTRFMRATPDEAVSFSPDGTRYAILTLRGDLAKNGIVGEIVSGGTATLAKAKPRVFRNALFTSGLSDFRKSPITLTLFNHFVWVDDDRLAFLWNDDRNVAQVLLFNLDDGSSRFLTRSPANVEVFDVSQNGRVVYAILNDDQRASKADLLHGFAVENDDAYSLMEGRIGRSAWGGYEWYVTDTSDPAPRHIELTSGDIDRGKPETVSISPNGDFAILDSAPGPVPTSWRAYTDRFLRSWVDLAQDPQRKQAAPLMQYFLVDLKAAKGRPLWSAPKGIRAVRHIAWSADGSRVAFGPTFLPLASSDAQARQGLAFVTTNVRTGAFQELPVPIHFANTINARRWVGENVIELAGKGQRICIRSDTVAASQIICPRDRTRLRISVDEDIKRPPRLLAQVGKGKTAVLFDPNPRLEADYALGDVENVSWTDVRGTQWQGRLYFPVGYDGTKAYPLVLQMHGAPAAHTFSLYGYDDPIASVGLGPGVSIFAAQPLANEGMFVLQVDDNPHDGSLATATEAQHSMQGLDAAINFVARRVRIDQNKVGLAAWSRSGWHAEYLLTHSSRNIAAAIISDAADGSYVQAILNGVGDLGVDGQFAGVNGGLGYGLGLTSWLKNAPGFNSERVSSPLRLQVEGGYFSLLAPWEMFTLLRVQHKPVEMYVVPDIVHGTHTLQNPRQVLASQQGAVDWFDFWLNGHEDSDPAKREQYLRWEKLCDLQRLEKPSRPTFCISSRSRI